MEIPALDDAVRLDCDVLVIGGGTAGTMAALTAAGVTVVKSPADMGRAMKELVGR